MSNTINPFIILKRVESGEEIAVNFNNIAAYSEHEKGSIVYYVSHLNGISYHEVEETPAEIGGLIDLTINPEH
jgi:hypothetical protein